MSSEGYFFHSGDAQTLKYHDLLKKLACLFAGLGHLQPLLLATTNSHYLLDRFCMERCCSGEYISRIVTSIIFMETLSILVVRIVLYFTLGNDQIWGKWQGSNATGANLNTHNKDEEWYRGIGSSIILFLIFLGYIQILYAFLSGGKKGHMHWFYASLLIQHFLNSLIAGSIGFWEVGLALWYLVTLPMAPIPVFIYQLIIHSWIRNNGPRNIEYIVVEYQIWLAICLSFMATILWILSYCQPITPIELDIQNWGNYNSTAPKPSYTYSVRDNNVSTDKKDIWAGGKCLYASKAPATSTKDQYLYLEIASGGTIQKRFYHRQNDQPWKEHTNPDKTPAINLYVNGVLGMIIETTDKRRVSIRTEDTNTYVNTPKLGLYRAYKYQPGGSFNITAFIKSGPYGCETLVGVPPSGPPGTPTDRVSLVIVYCSLDHTPLLICYKTGQTNTHHWFRNTGQNNKWASAAGLGAPPTGTQNANAATVRNLLEEVNCLVNKVVQINVSNKGGSTEQPYCHAGGNPKRIKVSRNLATDYGLSDGPYKVYEHSPNGSPTLTISAFIKTVAGSTTNYLNGIGGTTDSYITGVTRVVVFLNAGTNNPCLIYYERPGETPPRDKHNWYKYNGSTSRWQNAAAQHGQQLQDKSPEQTIKEAKTELQSILQTITGDAGQQDPDSTTNSPDQLTLSEGTPTDQYNRDYHSILNSYVWLPLLMQGLSVGAVGSIFPNLIPKTLVCAKTSRTLSVINMFLVTLPHIFNVMLGDMDLLSRIGTGDDWKIYKGWPFSLLLYLFYILAILFAIFNIHYPEWTLSSFLRNNTLMVFLMILFTDVLNETFNAISRAGICSQKAAGQPAKKNHPCLHNKIACLMNLTYIPFWMTTTPMMKDLQTIHTVSLQSPLILLERVYATG